jgi:hypothetical protein
MMDAKIATLNTVYYKEGLVHLKNNSSVKMVLSGLEE